MVCPASRPGSTTHTDIYSVADLSYVCYGDPPYLVQLNLLRGLQLLAVIPSM